MASVEEQWLMHCPSCGDDSRLTVQVKAWAKLSADGTDVDDSDHEWNGESQCYCGCGWGGIADDAMRAVEEGHSA